MKKVLLLLLMAGLWGELSYAQSPWLSDTRQSAVSFEWDKPVFDDRTFDQDDVTGASSVLFLTGRVKTGENILFVAELPLSHFGYKSSNPFGGDDNSTSLGNIYAGSIFDINMKNPDAHSFIELGVRIPTAPSPRDDERFGSNTGRFAELDRREAFSYDTWAIPLIGNYITPVTGPFAVKFRLGTVYDIFVDELEGNDNELHLLYGLTGMYRNPSFEAQLGFSGRNQYAGLPSGIDFWDSGATQLRAGIALPFRNIVPGIHARMPLGDNYTQVLDFAYGISLEIRR